MILTCFIAITLSRLWDNVVHVVRKESLINFFETNKTDILDKALLKELNVCLLINKKNHKQKKKKNKILLLLRC